MGLTERHWFEDEEPELTENQLEDILWENNKIFERGYQKGFSDGKSAILREQEVGKWIKLQGMAPPEYHGHKICSVCESFAPYDPIHPWREMLSPYCPGCGAKMEVTGDV